MLLRLEAHRSALLALSLLSACAAAGVDGTGSLAADGNAATTSPAPRGPVTETAAGLFLAARLAGQNADLPDAATLFLRALALDPSLLLMEHPSASLNRAEALRVGPDLRHAAELRHLAALTFTADREFGGVIARRVLLLEPATGRLRER